MCQFERFLDGSETLGLEIVTDPASPLFNKVPIPPVLDYQCDTAIIRSMKNLGTRLICRLWKKISVGKQEDWFELFLTGFIIINNIEYVYGVQEKFMQSYSTTTVSLACIKSSWTSSLIHITQDDVSRRTQRSSERMMERWVWSAQHLLYVFKTFFADFRPFTKQSGEWPADTAHLDSTQAAYLHNVTRATGSPPTP